MSFTEKAPAFLFENYTRNDKEWFKANRETYENELLKPFAELISFLAPTLKSIDREIICDPGKVSRIYRDARFAKGGPIFRQSLWCSICRKKEPFVSKPEFYFYISPDGFGWGCGYYRTPRNVMESMRKLISGGDKTAKAALRAYSRQDRFSLTGEMYKRDRFPDRSDKLKEWLNRKSVCLCYDGEDPELLFSEELAQYISDDFKSVADVYRLYIKAEEEAAASGTR
ncbi:MAG: DUF2461 domain-containing protein [Ruminococcus sp.]|nr:DUF2461 domain-containing protein [Ruminococcus sp.]